MIHFVVSVPLLVAALNARMDIISRQRRVLVYLIVMCLIVNSAISHRLVPDAKLGFRLILQGLNAQLFVKILLVRYALSFHTVILAQLASYQSMERVVLVYARSITASPAEHHPLAISVTVFLLSPTIKRVAFKIVFKS